MDNKNWSSSIFSLFIYRDYRHNMGKVQFHLELHSLFTLTN